MVDYGSKPGGDDDRTGRPKGLVCPPRSAEWTWRGTVVEDVVDFGTTREVERRASDALRGRGQVIMS